MAHQPAEPLRRRRHGRPVSAPRGETQAATRGHEPSRERPPIGPERTLVPSYLRLLLTSVATGAAQDEPSAGSPHSAPLLRRVLGKALIDAFCPFGRPVCEDAATGASATSAPKKRASAIERCSLARACPYGVLFAESLTARPPFALFVPDRGTSAPGLEVELTLFGPATGFYAWALRALARALLGGVGPQRVRFSVGGVERVAPDGAHATLCGPDLTALPADLAPDLLATHLDPFLAPAPVTIDLLSPCRLKTGQRLLGQGPIPFDVLVARILDRYRDLYGEASELLRPDIRRIVLDEAAQVPLLADATRWVEVHDYSARKDQEMLMGGLVGRLVYGAAAARFFPILRVGEILHVGKNAASGCGRIRILLPKAKQ